MESASRQIRAIEPMKMPLHRGLWAACAVTLVLAVLTGMPAHAQEAQPPEATSPPTPTPTPAPTPIPAADIPERAAATRTLLRDGLARAQIDGELEQMEKDFTAEKAHLEILDEDTRRRLALQGPASVIEETEKAWVRVGGRLDTWLLTLRDRAARIDQVLQSLGSERALWQLTLEAARQAELPTAVRQEIEETVHAVVSTEGEVRTIRDRVLVLQSRISRAKGVTDDMLARQREEILLRRRGLMGVDSPPLWRALSLPGVDGSPAEQLTAMWRKNVAEIRSYVADETTGLVWHLLFLVVTVAVLLRLRSKAQLWVQQDGSLERSVRALERPLAAALIVAILLRRAFHPDAPLAWHDLLGLVLVLAFLRTFPLLVRDALRPLGYDLALLYFFQQAAELAPAGNLIDRLLLLVMAMAGAWTAWWTYRQVTRNPPPIPRGWYRLTLVGSRLAIALFVVSAVANAVGAVGLAAVLVTETLFCIFSAVIFWITAVVLRAVIRVVVLNSAARRLGVVRLHADKVRSALFRLVDIGAVIGWVVAVLIEVKALVPTTQALKRVLGARLPFGEITVVPGDILLFAVVVWVSFKLSRLIRISLDTDVYPRMELPRGVPGAINRLTHYTVVVFGVMIGATAAGLDFSRLTFVIGALGVGIGFGLQNVVNNFVSGLILLFERPIRIGDRVELGQLSGVVEHIGIRASIVRTWQGAEVIVPNANLISSEVINWTLSDDRRRMEIPVGVAYGTDPEVVIELLLEAAQAHPEVLADPEPAALFMGFGESSLDFQLRAWTTGDIVRIPSELRLTVNRALADAGIEIPFPQRDLHLRSVDAEASDKLRGS